MKSHVFFGAIASMPDRSTRGPLPAFDRSAAVYDTVYAWKDYAAESRRVRDLVRRYGPRPSRTLLDVACGTGEHLRHLSRWFRCTGVDRNAAMLRVARAKLPHVRMVRAPMQTFRVGARFDVVTCLFSAIGYVRSEADLVRTLRNFARHLRPGGIAIVEPWLTPSEYATGDIHVQEYGSESRPIVRMNTSLRRRGRSILDMHYLVGGQDRIRHWVERHDMALFDVRTMRRAFRTAGFRVRHLPSRFTTRRGLYVGVRPGTTGRTGALPRYPARQRRAAHRRPVRRSESSVG